MPATTTIPNKVLKFFQTKKIRTLDQIAFHLKRSKRTVHRRLKQWRAINSYNKNGRYYTLPDVPKFDANGLWRYRGVFFSKYGNLTQTILTLLRNSKAGLNSAEMEKLLGLQTRSYLTLFRNHPDLKRVKQHRCFVYFSSQDTLYAQQHSLRLKMIQSATVPSDSEAIAILVETIKHPQLSIEELCLLLRKKKYRISPETVRNLFAYHGLTEKKTPSHS